MNNEQLEHLRHSCAHLLAAAVMELWPETKRTIGPSIENGFYYDFDFGDVKITEEDLPKIEEKMREILSTWDGFAREEVTAQQAKKAYAGNDYKMELIEEFAGEGQTLTFYRSGNFSDLCRGGHCEHPQKELSHFKLLSLAGAYWRGSEKNKMLTRIYGTCFQNGEELDAYLVQIEEAKKRDHRKLGKELKLFTFSDLVGPGLPLWLPNGTAIADKLEDFAKVVEAHAGYLRVRTPHLAKEILFKTSGHLPYYAPSMFPPMIMDEGDGHKETYYLKAMNCPHHHLIYASEPRSYRDLPMRLAEYGTVYRYEKSGELFGLMRVRMLSMNDAHIYCTPEQFASEFRAVNEMYLKYFKAFGFEKYIMRFSTHDPAELGKKYIDNADLWKKTEDMVRDVLVESKIPFVEVSNEAAFYGPKIDVQVWSSIGKEFTIATNQVDFAVPERFGLVYTDSDGLEKTPIAIHRAPLGTHERFIGFLIEHYGGAFPFWLAPVQVRLTTVSSDHVSFAQTVLAKLVDSGIRAELDASSEKLGKKIRDAAMMKIPWTIVIGQKEVDGGAFKIKVFGTEQDLMIEQDQFVSTAAQQSKFPV